MRNEQLRRGEPPPVFVGPSNVDILDNCHQVARVGHVWPLLRVLAEHVHDARRKLAVLE